jgi:hypothetical protein
MFDTTSKHRPTDTVKRALIVRAGLSEKKLSTAQVGDRIAASPQKDDRETALVARFTRSSSQ